MIQIKRGAGGARHVVVMARYLIELLDHGGNVRVADWIYCEDDAHAISRAKQMDIVAIGIGYDVSQGDRLVFSHRRHVSARAAAPAAAKRVTE